jgi:fatty-acid desaturase
MKQLNNWYTNPLLYFHILSHLSIIGMLMYATPLHWMISFVMYYLFGCWGIAITYHRLISHKSFVAPTWFKIVGMTFGSLAGVGSSIQWTAVHRDHHRHVDSDKDPHNPAGSLKRFLQMQFLTMLVPSSPKYAPDLLRDKTHQLFHKYYWLIHIIFAVTLYMIDPFSLIYAYLFPSVVLWHIMASLGTFAHTPMFGTQPTSQADKSTNLRFLGWFAFGEGWHNNHHAEASNYRFGRRPGEGDLAARIIEKIRID